MSIATGIIGLVLVFLFSRSYLDSDNKDKTKRDYADTIYFGGPR